MVISKATPTPVCNIHVDNQQLKQVKRFVYLGSTITEDGRCDEEIKRRIGTAKTTFNTMRNILTNININLDTRKRTMKAYIWSTLMYGSETWTISSKNKQKLEVMEMWLYRRMLRIPWTAHMTNQQVLELANSKRTLITTIRERQLNFLGHVLRRHTYEHLSLTGSIEGRKARGRPRWKFISSILDHLQLGIKPSEFIQMAEDRQRWKSITAHVS